MYDVVIIGAGVAGALIADQLSQQNLKIAVLEAGPNDQNRAALMDRFFARSLSRFTENGVYPFHPQAAHPSAMAPHEYYVQKGPEIFLSSYNRRVGGTTWSWQGTALRFLPNDFKSKTLYGYGDDWPLDYDDLKPWYDRAEKALGVSFDFPSSCAAQSVNQALKGKTYEGRPFIFETIPHARDIKRCCGSGICVPICPVQAKYDATIHVNKAVKQGVTLIPQAVVFKIHADKSGRITHLSYYDWEKRIHTIQGKTFVLAAHGVESPRLLLLSANDHFPQGIGNQHDQVGRYLMEHPIRLSVAQAPEPIYPYRGPQQTNAYWGMRDGDFRKKIMPYYTAIQNDAGAWPKRSPYSNVDTLLDQGLYGNALKSALHDTLNRQLVLCSECEQLPVPSNRVALSNEAVDYYGLPRPEIYYDYSPVERETFKHMDAFHQSVFEAVGATQIEHVNTIFSACHIIGTLRMGNNPAQSVVNAECQVHGHENLYVAGSSVFTTAGTANPTLTISALALRLAAKISE